MKHPFDENDDDLWRTFVQNIRPLTRKERIIQTPKKPSFRQYQTGHLPKNSFIVPVLPKKKFEKNIYIDGQIDLHGMTENSAYSALCAFVTLMLSKKHAWGLVITGKSGVLFEMTPKWLNSMEGVRFCTPSRPIHGGTGALYIRFV